MPTGRGFLSICDEAHEHRGPGRHRVAFPRDQNGLIADLKRPIEEPEIANNDVNLAAPCVSSREQSQPETCPRPEPMSLSVMLDICVYVKLRI